MALSPIEPILTPEQQAEAVALYSYLLAERRNGTRQVVVHLDDDMAVRPVGRRVSIKGLTVRDKMTVKVQPN